MGLLDFLTGRRAGRSGVIRETKGERTETVGGVPVTVTASARLERVEREPGAEDDYETPPYTLRKLKTYDESARPSCGFDLSAVRRCRGDASVWWLEGSNYERATSALLSLGSFEEEARAHAPGLPRAVGFIAENSQPYAVGEDGNRVPTIASVTGKAGGERIEASWNVRPSERSRHASARVWFDIDGRVSFAQLTCRDGHGGSVWRMEAKAGRDGVMRLSLVKRDREPLYKMPRGR